MVGSLAILDINTVTVGTRTPAFTLLTPAFWKYFNEEMQNDFENGKGH